MINLNEIGVVCSYSFVDCEKRTDIKEEVIFLEWKCFMTIFLMYLVLKEIISF